MFESKNLKQIAFFDFDGTITTKDTLLEFIKFTKGTMAFYVGFLLYSPFLVAYKLKLISNQTAKEKVLAYFFKGMPVPAFEEKCLAFAKQVIPGLLRPKALEEIKQLKEQGVQVVIVSASPENWIRPWASQVQAALLGTRLQTENGLLTGKIFEQNCHGNEKVKRIKACYQLSDYSQIYTYGDTSGDKPMLALGTNQHYKPFRN